MPALRFCKRRLETEVKNCEVKNLNSGKRNHLVRYRRKERILTHVVY
jgi:hypothetical protein